MNIKKGVINFTDDNGKKLQTVQIEGLKGEVNDNAEHYQNYGITTHPMPCDDNGEGSEAIFADLGNSTNRVIIASDDRRFRPKKTKAGDTVLYTHKDSPDAAHDDAMHRIALTSDGDTFKTLIKANQAVHELKNDNTVTSKNDKGSVVIEPSGDITDKAPNLNLIVDKLLTITAENIKTTATNAMTAIKEAWIITAKKVTIEADAIFKGKKFEVTETSAVKFVTPSFTINGKEYVDGAVAADDFNPPTNLPALGAIALTPTQSGVQDATLNFTYDNSGEFPADSFTMYVNDGTTPPTAVGRQSKKGTEDVPPPTTNSRILATMTSNFNSYVAAGLATGQTYAIGMTANRITPSGVVVSTEIVTGWLINGAAPTFTIGATSLLDGVLVGDITAAMVNYDQSNDLNGDPIAAPTNVAISHTMNSNGSCNVQVSWDWAGDEASIDGFAVVWHINDTDVVIPLGVATDHVTTVYRQSRDRKWLGIAADSFYTAGVLAYRAVVSNVAASGLIISTITAIAPYRPNPAPNITISVGGIPANQIAADSVNYNAANDKNGDDIAAVTGLTITSALNHDGSADVTVSWAWSGANADIDGFGVYHYSSTTNAAHAITGADVVDIVLPGSRSRVYRGIPASLFYTCGVQAYRAVDKSVIASRFILSPFTQYPTVYQPTTTPNITATVNGVSASSISSAAVNYNAGNDLNSSAINAVTGLAISSVMTSTGAANVTVSWAWSGANADIDGFAIIYKTQATGAPYIITNADLLAQNVRPDQRSYQFQGIDSTLFYTVAVLVFRSVNKVINNTGFVISAFTQYPAAYQPNSAPNITANVGGTPAATLAAQATAGYNYALAMLDDGVLSAGAEKQAARGGWDAIYIEYGLLVTQGNVLGVSTAALSTAGQNLATFLNAGTTYVAGIPIWLQDANLGLNTTASGVTYRSYLSAYQTAKTNLVNAMDAKAATTATWNAVTAKPATVYNTNDAMAVGFNPTFSAWSGALPDGWSDYSGLGIKLKETSLVRIGDYSVRFNACTTTVNNGIAMGINLSGIPTTAIFSGSIDVYLESRSAGAPSFYLYLATANNGTTIAINSVQPPITTGVWHRVPFSIRGDGVKTPGFLYLIVAGSLPNAGQGFTGNCIFDNFQYTIQEGAIFDNTRQQMSQVAGQATSAQILDSAITAVKTNLAAINASTGNVSATQATVISGFFGTLSAITANLGTVNAGNITGSANISIAGTAVFTGYSMDGGNTTTVLANNSETYAFGVLGKGTLRGVKGATTGYSGVGVFGENRYGGSNGGYGVYGYGWYSVGVGAESLYGVALQVTGKARFSSEDTLINNKKIVLSNANTLAFGQATSGTSAAVARIPIYIDGSLYYINLGV